MPSSSSSLSDLDSSPEPNGIGETSTNGKKRNANGQAAHSPKKSRKTATVTKVEVQKVVVNGAGVSTSFVAAEATEVVKKGSKRVRKEVVYAEEEEQEEVEEVAPKKAKGKAKADATSKRAVKAANVEADDEEAVPKKKRRAKKDDIVDGDEAEAAPPPKKTRKPRTIPVDPFAPESLALHPVRLGPISGPYHTDGRPTHFVGAHTSTAGGPEHALIKASELGANALAVFLKNQRRWESKPMEEESVQKFRKFMLEKSLGGLEYANDCILPHGSYLINLANPDATKRETSYQCFIDDLRRCEQLGIKLYNWHPGSTVGACSIEEACKNVADGINRAHKETTSVICVIENMAGAGNILGSTWEQLAEIIKHVEDKSRVGVCIDTCHAFAAGYDIRTSDTYAATIGSFDKIVGLGYLKGMHLNDSKTELGGKKDRHENIGLGEIGLAAFRHVLRDPRLSSIPLILETPTFEETTVWRREIEILYEIQAIEGTDDEVEARLTEITDQWRTQRDEIRRVSGKGPKEKEPSKAAKAKKGGKKGKKDDDEDEDDDEE